LAQGVFSANEEMELPTALEPKAEGVLPVSLVDDAIP
jgi:hypothetical protein